MRGQDDGPTVPSPVPKHVRFAHESGGVDRARDNAHGLLSVVAAVAETVGRGGQELQLAKPFVHDLRRLVLQNPVSCDHEAQTENHSHDRGYHDKDQSLVPAFRNDDGKHGRGASVKGGMHHGGAGVAPDQGVGRRRWKSPPPGENIPNNGAEQRRHDDVLIHIFQADHAFANGVGDRGAKEKSGKKVERGGPEYG